MEPSDFVTGLLELILDLATLDITSNISEFHLRFRTASNHGESTR